MKKRLFVFGLILIICFSSFNFAFADVDTSIFENDYLWVNNLYCINADYLTHDLPKGTIPMGFTSGKTLTIDNHVIEVSKNETMSSKSTVYYDVYLDGEKIREGIIASFSDQILYIGFSYTYISSSNEVAVKLAYSDLKNYFGNTNVFFKYGVNESIFEEPLPTMYLHNVTDPLTDDFYVGVNNPLYRNLSLKVTYRRSKEDEFSDGGVASVGHGYYEFNKSNLGITDTGEYLFSLFDNGKLICICELTLTQRNYDGEPTMELCNVSTPLDDSFYLSVNNPMATTCVLKVTYQATSDDEFTSICTQDIEYSRTYNLTKQDLAMKKDGNYLFSLFDSFGNLLIVKKLNDVVLVSNGGSGIDGNFGLAFNYPELPDNANVIDYIKWFCQCVVITFQSIGIVILEFSTSCSNFVRMITRFLNFMPKEFLVLLPIVLTVCVILRFLGR